MKKTPLIVTLVFLALAVIGFGLWMRRASLPAGTVEGATNSAQKVIGTLLSSPSPTPFQEMTIPYLRQRSYQSQLNELQPLSKAGNYTSSLTSYDSDGLKINALITQPTGEMPEGGWPAIVFVHGYIPPEQYRTQEKYVEYVNSLARSGFVVFKIDLRGHGSSEGEASGSYYSADYVIDALNAYSALQNASFVNKEKIGFWGHSMAGNIILRALVSKMDVPVAVIWGGAGFSYEDLQEFGIDDNSYRAPSTTSDRQRRRKELFDMYGQFDPKSPFWSKVIPTNYLSDLKTAIQLDHAVNDDVVSIEYSRNLDKLLDQAGIEHELNEYAQGGHNITNPSFTPAMQKTIEFFKKHL